MTGPASKDQARLDRQFDAMGRRVPVSRPVIATLRDRRFRLVRIPLAILLIVGSFLAILPVFGLWMMPLGLLLLAVDLPVLRPRVNALLIRLRRRLSRHGAGRPVARDD